MIASLRGQLTERDPVGRIVVEVGGIGYRVVVAASTSAALGPVGDEVFVHVHHHMREDGQTLYGFCTVDERACFEAVLGAHGVGPALALAIMSVHGPVELRRVLADDDVDALCLVPGVGKKTATRLLVELKSRLDLPDVVDLRAVQGGAAGNGAGALADVREALANLGYSTEEIRAAVVGLDPAGDVSVLVKQALLRLAGEHHGA